MKSWNQSFGKGIACAALVLSLISCVNNGSDDGGGTTQAPPGAPTVAVTSPMLFPSGPVRITFSVTNFTIGLVGTPHLHFSIDGVTLHDFQNGTSIPTNDGVVLNGVHTHAVHWTSPTSFDLFALPAGNYQVRLALVDQNNQELPGASTTHDFTVQQPPVGALQLVPVLPGLNFAVGLSQAPDGRIFYNERLTGAIRIINIVNSIWELDSVPFCQVSIQSSGAEQGLLGLALDPNFSTSNETVYIYYTFLGPPVRNRVSKLTKAGGICTETVIPGLDNLPTANNHNGGIIQFGPDGMLYVVIGDADDASNANNLTSLAGKILRVNPDGSAPANNPFFSNLDANAQKVFSFGHRNSYGFTFHPHTNHLWESENSDNDNDEVNRVVAGGNYGWDVNRRAGMLNDPCCIDPILAFNPTIAPTGIIAIPENSSIYPPAYWNNLLVAAYLGGTIHHVILSGQNLDELSDFSLAYTGGQGGLLSLMLSSDGYVYVSDINPINGSSSIFRVVPN